ncbi:MAG: hypothetical protein M1147_11710 [Nitrospirae bacterium]|nr:hypothetical protein [Nitrospirota bacterium]MCL5978756.1 hypothetical protein [Nitrospirota bacterium]
MIKMITTPFLVGIVFAICMALMINTAPAYCEAKPFYKEILFDKLDHLVISEDKSGEISVALFQGKRLTWKVTIANGMITNEDIRELELDKSNDTKEILIEIQDRTSNYGARTGIVIYKLIWWELLLIPDDAFELIYNAKDNISEIKMTRLQNKTVILNKGLLLPKE